MTYRTPRLGLTPGPVVGGQMNGYLTPGMVAGGCVCSHVGLGPDLGLGLGLGLGFGVPSESANLPSAVGRGRMCSFAGFVCLHARPLLPPCALNGFERSKPFKAHPPNRDRLRGHTNPFKAHRTFTACTHRQGPALRDWSAARPGLRRHTRPRKQKRVLRFPADSAREPADRMDSAFRWRHGWPSKRGRTILFLVGSAGDQASAKGEVGTEVAQPQFKCGMSGPAALPVRPRRGAAGARLL